MLCVLATIMDLHAYCSLGVTQTLDWHHTCNGLSSKDHTGESRGKSPSQPNHSKLWCPIWPTHIRVYFRFILTERAKKESSSFGFIWVLGLGWDISTTISLIIVKFLASLPVDTGQKQNHVTWLLCALSCLLIAYLNFTEMKLDLGSWH